MELENKLLDTVREKCGIPSDNALSKKLGVTRALVSGWRLDRYAIPDERIAEMCAMADLDGPWWIAEIHAAKAQSRVERKLWRAMADRLSAAAAVVALVALSMPGLANAKTAQIQAVSGAENGSMYIMFKAAQRLLAQPPCSYSGMEPDVERCEFGAACAATCSN